MFSEIEKEYRKSVQERRYWAYYIKWAVPITVVAAVLSLVFRHLYGVILFVTTVLLVGILITFIVHDIKATEEMVRAVRRKRGVIAKLQSYFETDDAMRVNNLVTNLAKHDIRTKEDLKLAIEYYESRLPMNTKPNLMDWILTTIVTVASVALVAYDEATSTIDVQKFLNVFISALIVAAICITPILVFKIVRYALSRFRNRVDTILVEDLAEIYVNFEGYGERFEKAKEE